MSGGDWRRGPQVDLPVRQWPARHHIRRTVSVPDVLLVGWWQWRWWCWWWYINSKYQQFDDLSSVFWWFLVFVLRIAAFSPSDPSARRHHWVDIQKGSCWKPRIRQPRCTCYWQNYFGRKVTGSRSQWQTEILSKRRLVIDWLSVWEARHGSWMSRNIKHNINLLMYSSHKAGLQTNWRIQT